MIREVENVQNKVVSGPTISETQLFANPDRHYLKASDVTPNPQHILPPSKKKKAK